MPYSLPCHVPFSDDSATTVYYDTTKYFDKILNWPFKSCVHLNKF